MITEIRHSFGNRNEPRGGWNPGQWETARPRWKQVHGVASVRVEAPAQECGDVDALWTTCPGIPIAVVTADCVPVLLERDDRSAVAAVHAGWRGTRARILRRFFDGLPPEHADPSRWRARIGPSIRACCYEVGEDLIREFTETFPDLDRSLIEPAPRKLDLAAVTRSELEGLGVVLADEHGDCTFCSRTESGFRYFSYRRGDRNSRQFSVISILSDL